MLGRVEQLPGLGRRPDRTHRPWTARRQADDVPETIIAVLEMSWVTGQTVFADGGLALHSPIDAYGQMRRLMARGGRQ